MAVLAVQPAAAAPGGELDRGAGWIGTLEAWWGGLVDRLVAASGGSETDGGPGMDPAGASAGGGEEADGGPSIDPWGVSASEEEESDGGPGIDPLG